MLKVITNCLKEHFRIKVSKVTLYDRFLVMYFSSISLISKKIGKWYDKSLLCIPGITFSKSKVVQKRSVSDAHVAVTLVGLVIIC